MTLVKQRPVRVLHVVGGMARAGTETWLMHVLRNIDRTVIQMDFVVHTTEKCAYDDEIRSLGSRVIPCMHPSKPWLYHSNFQRILQEYGPYDVVHSHVHDFSGYVLRLAHRAGVPVRIAHSHNDTSPIKAQAGWSRHIYTALMKRWIAHYATLGLAASGKAAVDLFGSAWKTEQRFQKLFCGVDLMPFHQSIDRRRVRAELGIPTDAFVIGHVGRFDQQKNHSLLVEIAAQLSKSQANMRLLLIGNGSLRKSIEQKVRGLDLNNHIVFAGARADVPRLMLNVMDVFVLPSLYEGLGLVLIEAQAAGLPCVLSDVVPEEADVVKALIHRVSLSQSTSIWAETILAANQTRSIIKQSEALSLVKQSPFNILTGVQKLKKLYLSASYELAVM